MSLRIRAVRLTVATEAERFVSEVHFDDGLNLVRAENNMGKTTLLMAALYALGWEGMLGPAHEVPMTPAVTEEIADGAGRRWPVLESSAAIELQGAGSKSVTLQRPIRSKSEDPKLVHTWHGPVLTRPGTSYEARDSYVRMQGAAQREAGLQFQLARFIGWEMPTVATWDGGEVPLYMELLAPFLFVEQTRGWGWIAAVMPRYLRVRDPERRATEFLLSLESLTRGAERDVVLAERDELRSTWRATIQAFRARVGEVAGLLENVPLEPAADWPPPVPPVVRIHHDNEWRPCDYVIEHLRAELVEISREVPRAEEVAETATRQLYEAEEGANRISGLVAAAARDVREQQADLQSLDARLAALREDRARYDDAIRLRGLGSLQELALENARCPTCDHELAPTLLGRELQGVMSLDENRELIVEEIATFGAMRDDAQTVLEASRQRLRALRGDLDELRRTIRALKSTLTQNSGAPARAVIARQVRLADQIERLEGVLEGLEGLDVELAELASSYRRVLGELNRLGERGALSDADSQTLRLFAELLRDQLDEYGFSSMPPQEIAVSPDTYLPIRHDSPVRPDQLSASDRVRMVWAYVGALLEASRERATAHPGLLILDEPGQQEISDASLRAFLRRLAATERYGQQVIVATSERTERIRDFTEGEPTALTEIRGYALKPER